MRVESYRKGKAFKSAYPIDPGMIIIDDYNPDGSKDRTDEIIYGSGKVALLDVTESGLHRCRVVRIAAGDLKEAVLAPDGEFWTGPCPVCQSIEQRGSALVALLVIFLLLLIIGEAVISAIAIAAH